MAFEDSRIRYIPPEEGIVEDVVVKLPDTLVKLPDGRVMALYVRSAP